MSERDSERDLAAALEPYIVNIQETGKEVGSGAYATVVEVEYFGTICVGKKLHRVLHEQGIGDLVRRFKEECRLLSQLRHPHIVQFIGVYFEPGSDVPVLVMEQLSTTLARHLDEHGLPREDTAFSILCDTALALRYLHGHNPPIIHRDLTANNVLLTGSLRAKVSDLGVARILNLTPLQLRNLTQVPGSPHYMPPEALVANPIYTTNIDAFSYGILMIHTFSGSWPQPTEAAVVPSSGIWSGSSEQAEVRALSEADRRQTYLNQIGHNHSSMSLILQCISNNPHCRPEAPEIHERVRGILADCRRFQHHAKDFVDDLSLVSSHSGYLTNTSLVSDIDSDLLKESEITRLQTQSMKLEADNTSLQAILNYKEAELHSKEVELEARLKTLQHQKDTEIELFRTSKEHEAKTLKQQYSAKLRAKEEETVTIQSSLESLLASRDKLLASKDDAITQYKSNIQALNDQIVRLQEIISNRSQLHPMHPHASLIWNEQAKLPHAMTGPQSVVIDGKVYVGGGDTESDDFDRRITRYDPVLDQWATLPPCPVKLFALGQFMNKLITAGGISARSVTRDVHTFDAESQQWVLTIPAMLTARHSAVMIEYRASLVVAGGAASPSGDLLASVEAYKHGMWFTTDTLPFPCATLSCAVFEGNCYFVGGFKSSGASNKSVFHADIDTLLQNARNPATVSLSSSRSASSIGSSKSLEASISTTTTWTMLTEAQCLHSSPAFLGSCLLALGGATQALGWLSAIPILRKSATRKSILAYCSINHKWQSIGELPTACAQCTVALLPTGELLVIGGRDSKLERSTAVFKGRLQTTPP